MAPRASHSIGPLVWFGLISCLLVHEAAAIDYQFGQSNVSSTALVVNFDNTIANPVVIAFPATYNEGDFVMPVVSNVGASSFTLRLWEPVNNFHTVNLDHAFELVSWVVVRTGTTTINLGTGTPLVMQADTVAVSGLGEISVTYPSAYTNTPVVFAQPQDGNEFIHNRIRSVSTTGFLTRLEREESLGGSPSATVGWLSITAGTNQGDAGGLEVIVSSIISPDSVTHLPFELTFSGITSADIAAVVLMAQTRDGGNSGWVRRNAVTGNSVEVWIEEDQFNDNEVSHTTEVVGGVAVACADTPLTTGSNGPFSNSIWAQICPFLYYTAAIGQVPYVVFNIVINSGVFPSVYLHDSQRPTLSTFQAKDDTQSSGNFGVALVNPVEGNSYMGIYSTGTYSATLSYTFPSVQTVVLATPVAVTAANHWHVSKFLVAPDYDYVDIIVKPQIATTVEVYYRQGAMPTRHTNTFEQSSLAANGDGEYIIRVSSLSTTPTVEYFIGIYTPLQETGVSDLVIQPAAPVTSGLNPSFGPTDAVSSPYEITIQGRNFGDGVSSSVQFGGQPCQAVAGGSPYRYQTSAVICGVPAGQGKDIRINVTHYGITSNSQLFDYDPPLVDPIPPSTKLPTAGGFPLTLTGSNFGLQFGSVTINGVPCTLTGPYSHSELSCISPEGQGLAEPVFVVVDGQSSNQVTVNYLPPVISYIDPAVGPTKGGTNLTIVGTNFGKDLASDSNSGVTIDSVDCPISTNNHTHIFCTVPSGQGTARAIAVIVASQANVGGSFAFSYEGPTITTIQPANTTTQGGVIRLQGSNFGTSGTVSFGGGVCTHLAEDYSDSDINCTAPAGVGAGLEVKLTVSLQESNIKLFSYFAPHITNVSPLAVGTAGGTNITLTGTSFGVTSTTATVTAGGLPCNIIFLNHTMIVCQAPAGSGTGRPVSVLVSGQQSNQASFSYLPPTITSLFPTNGTTAGSTVLTIQGQNFGTNGEVRVGGALCTLAGAGYTQSLIECLTAPGQGVGKQVVVTIGGQSGVSPTDFSYNAPEILSVSPGTGPTQGDIPITLNGANFGSVGTIFVNDRPCIVSGTYIHTTAVCTLPTGSGSNLNVGIFVSNQVANLSAFTYSVPSIATVTPQGGASDSQDPITITGSSFDTSGVVTVGGAVCDQTGGSYSHQQIICNLPIGQGAASEVVVTTVDNKQNTPALYAYAPPSITALDIESVPTLGGPTLTLSGTSFGTSGNVTVAGKPCEIVGSLYDHQSIQCTLPAGQGLAQPVVVSRSFQTSTAANLDYSAPVIGFLHPTSAPTQGGTNLTVVGTNFGTHSTTVTVGGTDCPVLEVNYTAAICRLPAGQGDESVRIFVSTQASNVKTFSYDAPTLTSVFPTTGDTVGGQLIVLRGSSLGSQGTGSVLVGAANCEIQSHNDTVITCLLPAGQGAGQLISVSVGGKTSNTVSFDYNPPTLYAVTPNHAPTAGGTILYINGTNLGLDGFVFVGTVTCPVVAGTYSHFSVNCTLPAGSGVGLPLVVRSAGRDSNAVTVNYDPPEIDSVTQPGGPTSGQRDQVYVITVAGRNFGSQGEVKVDGVPCPVQSASFYKDDEIQCLLPIGQGVANVQVTVSTQISNVYPYTYGAPVIASVVPSNGPTSGGTIVTMQGTDFGVSGTVLIGGRVCRTDVPGTQHDHTRIECSTSIGAGLKNQISINVSSQFSIAPDIFDYDRAVVDEVTNNTGTTDGGYNVTLTGSNFAVPEVGPANVTIDGAACDISLRTHTSITCLAPAGVGASRTVQVYVNDQPSLGVQLFSYLPPVISSINSKGCVDQPSTTVECPTAGNVELTLVGSNFGASGATVTVNGQECTAPTYSVPHSNLTCTLPAGLGFDIPVVLTAGQQASNSVLIAYRGPIMYSDTLRLDSASHTKPVQLTSVAGGDTIVISGNYLDLSGFVTSVKFGLPGKAFVDLEYTCAPITTLTINTIECQVPAGVGRDLVVIVSDGEQVSPVSTDTLSYPRPEIVPGTIREGLTEDYQTKIVGSQSEGEFIYFDALNVGTDESRVTVFYGQPGGPYDQECSSVTLTVGVNTTIRCKTQPGEGKNFVFVVNALNYQSLEGTDQYSYPQAPIIHRVYGCTNDVATNSTSNCPTKGGPTITILGEEFSSTVSVKVGVNDCLDVVKQSSTEILCRLPAGAGFNTPVVVLSGLLFSRSKQLLSYAAPTLTSVSGCFLDVGNETTNCKRKGNQQITVTGTNFGASEAIVLIGGAFCTSVTHDTDTPHEKLTCRTPPGGRLSRSLVLIQDQGEVSPDRLFVSYSQCTAGQYDASTATFLDVTCTDCGPGEFSIAPGSQACTSCEAGFFNEDIKQTTCDKCTKGRFSVRVNGLGPQNCTACPEGTFTNADGQDACNPCGPGTFNNLTERTVCTDCPPGSATSSSGQTICSLCGSGTYAPTAKTLTCDLCPVGRATDQDGTVQCTECSPGYYAGSEGAPTCTPCGEGSAVGVGGQAVCVECDPGFFSNATALTSCFACPKGTFSQKVGGLGAQSCTPCAAGTFVSASGQATCLQCPQGEYMPSTGADACLKCPTGTKTDTIGRQTCSNCSAGTIAATVGTVTCSNCPAGKYAPLPGRSVCTDCEAGRSQEDSGRTTCIPCAAGKAVSTQGQPVCKDCDVGTFSNTTGHATCSRCPPGKVTGTAGLSVCSNCLPGFFAESEAQSFCKPCPVGTAGATGGLTVCSTCPVGKVAQTAESQVCTNCSAGFFSAAVGSGNCEKCPVGTFNDRSGASACTACPVGRAQDETQKESCDVCLPGFYTSFTGQAICLECPTGTFSNESEASFCYDCDRGKAQAITGQSVCTDCTEGSFQSASGQPGCNQCPVGKVSANAGQSFCDSCTPGLFAGTAGLTVCPPCGEGKFTDVNDAIVCSDCPAGKFNTEGGLSFCTDCAAGRSQGTPGSTVCGPCATGRRQPAGGQPDCIDCVAGEYQPAEAQPGCLLCPPGSFTDDSKQFTCVNCTTGKFAVSSGSVSCDDCPVGRRAPVTGLGQCIPCEPGFYQDESGKSVCKQCPLGRANAFSDQSACAPCTGGTRANVTGLKTCTACPAGRYSGFEASSCLPCAAGRFGSVAGLESCVDCSVGFRNPLEGQTSCIACSPGTFASAAKSLTCTNCSAGRAAANFGSQICEVCTSGSVSIQGQPTCTACAKGKAQASDGESVCNDCDFGEFASATGQAVCVKCPAGTYAPTEGLSVCQLCSPGTAQSATGASMCLDCLAGQAMSAKGQAACIECDAGTYSNSTGFVVCQKCPAGQFSVKNAQGKGATKCTDCAAGKFNGALGQPLCLSCDFGTFSNKTGESRCSDCPPGRFADFAGAQFCNDCDRGSFSTNGGVTCSACDGGTYGPEFGATSCVPCFPGSSEGRTGQENCTLCPPGSFMSGQGALVCDFCPAGRFNNRYGRSICQECSPGFYQDDVNATTCKPCEVGRFNQAPAQRSCLPCDQGSFTNETAQIVCRECNRGRFQDDVEKTQCQDCPVGLFTASNGLSACTACEPGFFNPINGSTRCSECLAGYAQGQPGATFCPECQIGRFTATPAQRTCLPCAQGSFTNETAQSECRECLRGRFQDDVDQTQCDDCPVGRFTSSNGLSACVACEPGFFNPVNGSTRCAECLAGYAQGQPGATFCPGCDTGRFTASPKATVCTVCEAGKFGNTSTLTVCFDCARGKVQPSTESDACDDCVEGKFMASTGQTRCLDCAGGNFAPTQGLTVCEECPVGRSQPLGAQSDCVDCELGRASNAKGVTACQLCKQGTFTNETKQLACSDCSQGLFQDDVETTQCNDCPVGRFTASTGLSVCSACDPGFFNPVNGSTRCAECGAGFAQGLPGQTSCLACAVGRHSPGSKATVCTVCPVGTFGNTTGLTECFGCERGTVQPNTEQAQCVDCEKGKYMENTRQTACLDCIGGTYAATEGLSVCAQCEVGRSQALPGQETCNDCETGRASNVEGVTACGLCEPGKFAPEEKSTNCTSCPIGKAQFQRGRPSCDPCDAGEYNPSENQASCLACPPGSYTNTTGQAACIGCTAGSFQVSPRQTACTICPPGQFTPSSAQPTCTLCARGSITPNNGSTSCKPCDPGFVQPSTGQTACVACPSGEYVELSSQTRCEACTPGQYNNLTGQSQCRVCVAGFVQSSPRQTACDICPSGSFQSEPEKTSCVACGPGLYNPNQGKSFCNKCERGRVQSSPSSSTCEACVPGKFQQFEERTECEDCPAGRFINISGISQCTQCAAGKKSESAARSTVCLDCEAGRATPPGGVADECAICVGNSVAPSPGLEVCVPCLVDAESNEAHTECLCRSGFYAVPTASLAFEFKCELCPEGALCETPGVTLFNIQSQEGWWREDNTTVNFFRCLIKTHCNSGAASASSATPCLGRRTGPLCSVCQTGFFAQTLTSPCEPCPSKQQSYTFSVLVSVIVVLAIIFMYYVILRSDRDLMKEAKELAEYRKTHNWAWFDEDEEEDGDTRVLNKFEKGIAQAHRGAPVAKPNFTFKMKIVLGFLQISTNLALALDIPWPSNFQSFIAVFNIFNFDFVQWSNVDCVVNTNWYDRYLAIVLTPLLLCALVAVFYLLPKHWQDIRNQAEDYDLRRAALQRSRRRFWKLFLFSLFLIYPGVSSTVVRMFVCREINGRHFLLADMSVRCFDSEWTKWALINIPFVLIYPIGIPAFFFYMLASNKKVLHKPDVRVQLGFLYEAYHSRLWWFELTDMANKLFLTSILGFFSYIPEWQMPIGIAAAVSYIIVLLMINPYIRKGDDRLHLFAQTEIFLFLLAGFVFLNIDTLDDASDVVMSAILILLTMALFILFALQIAKTVYKIWKKRQHEQEVEKMQEAAGEGGVIEEVEEKVAPKLKNKSSSTTEMVDLTHLRLPKNATYVRNPLFTTSNENLLSEEDFAASDSDLELEPQSPLQQIHPAAAPAAAAPVAAPAAVEPGNDAAAAKPEPAPAAPPNGVGGSGSRDSVVSNADPAIAYHEESDSSDSGSEPEVFADEVGQRRARRRD